jgi:beta-N-acetylhexosaminidase
MYNFSMRFLYIIILPLLFLSCTGCERSGNLTLDTDIEPVVIIDPLKIRAAEIVSLMDDRLLAAQVLISGVDGNGFLPQRMVELLTEIPAGGIMFFRYNLSTDNDSIRSMLTEITLLIKEESGVPPFIAVDHEGGTVNRFMHGVASLPAAASYYRLYLAEGKEAALAKIEEDSFRAGREINDLGFNMNFAPVAEHLVDDNRDFLHSRSYGPDPVFTALAASAFVRGMEQNGVLCVIKHFPGSAGPDPHYSPSVLDVDKAALDILASPFAALINDGVRAIMAAHTSAPVIDNEIASLSHAVMQNWLRDELGFDGIIISDDFIMAAAGGLSPEEAAVRSVAAGADMILVWPRDLRRTQNAFISALENEQLSRERLVNAVERIVYEKLRIGLIDYVCEQL